MTSSHEELLLELLNAIHEDGGSHTIKSGLRRSVDDAITKLRTWKGHSEALGIARNDLAEMKHRITRLDTELDEVHGTCSRLSDRLRETAVAIHGGPLHDGWWSFHDLPALAELLRRRASQELPVNAIETSQQMLARLKPT